MVLDVTDQVSKCSTQLEGNDQLIFTGIELIFFRVTGMKLFLGFVLKTVLVTQGCFRYC